MFYGYYGFSPITEQENKYGSRLIFRVFETEEERGKELSDLRSRWNGNLTPFIFTKEVCEKLNIKTIDDCIQVARKAFMFKLPIRQDEAQAYFANEEIDKFRKRTTCGAKMKTQIYSTNPTYNLGIFPTWQEQIIKIQADGLAKQREKDIYFYGKFEGGNNED